MDSFVWLPGTSVSLHFSHSCQKHATLFPQSSRRSAQFSVLSWVFSWKFRLSTSFTLRCEKCRLVLTRISSLVAVVVSWCVVEVEAERALVTLHGRTTSKRMKRFGSGPLIAALSRTVIVRRPALTVLLTSVVCAAVHVLRSGLTLTE